MIQLQGVSFTYPGADRPALKRITAAFHPGIIHLVTGPLGAGCSTLLLVASGLAPHTTGGRLAGIASTLGAVPSSADGRRVLAGRVGLLLPTPWTQLSGMASTVTDEIAFAPANHGWPRARIQEAVNAAMGRVGITHLRDREPGSLSGGELQRVMLAAVMAMDPEVYLLDEPALELDPAGAEELYRFLPELARNATVLVASTDVDRLAEVAERVLFLRDGECIGDGTPQDVLGRDEAVTARGSTTIAEIAQAVGLRPAYPVTLGPALPRFRT